MGKKRQSYDRKHWSKRYWYLLHKDKLETERRQSLLGNRWRGLNKRQYSGYCELCEQPFDRLEYHHWDDDNPAMGIWLCHHCHRYAEGFDKAIVDPSFLELYKEIKNRIATEYYQSRLL